MIGGDLNIIYPNKTIYPTFLALLISNGNQKKLLSKKAQGKSVVHLHNADLEEIELIYPKKEEQKCIIEYFKKIDKLISLHQRECKFLSFSLIQIRISLLNLYLYFQVLV